MARTNLSPSMRELLTDLDYQPIPTSALLGTRRAATFQALCVRKLARTKWSQNLGTYIATLTVAGFDAADALTKDA